MEGVAKVNAYEEIAGALSRWRNVATVVCVALIAILFVVSVLFIFHTIKLTTLTGRDEIAIMRMVGATNGFIRWPLSTRDFCSGPWEQSSPLPSSGALYAAVARAWIPAIPPAHPCDSFAQMWGPVAAPLRGLAL